MVRTAPLGRWGNPLQEGRAPDRRALYIFLPGPPGTPAAFAPSYSAAAGCIKKRPSLPSGTAGMRGYAGVDSPARESGRRDLAAV